METAVTRLRRFRRFLSLAAFAAGLALAGCGIKGPLDLPEGAAAPLKENVGTTKNARLPGYYEPSAREKKTQRQLGTPGKPDQPFVLDPLLN
jgi:predicted small lipoprotein YifL